MHHYNNIRESDFDYIFIITSEFYKYIHILSTVLIGILCFPLERLLFIRTSYNSLRFCLVRKVFSPHFQRTAFPAKIYWVDIVFCFV